MGLLKYVDLSNIPQKNGKYDWKNSIGRTCLFQHTNVQGILTIIDYKTEPKKSLILIEYNGISGWVSTTQFVRGGIGAALKIYTSDFKYNIGDILHQKTDIQILSCEKRREDDRNRKYYTYKCLNCNEEHTTTEAILKKGGGCPYCAGRIIKPGINDVATTDAWMIPFFKDITEAQKYTHGSTKEIYPYCPVCRRQSNKLMSIASLYTNHRTGCSCDTYMSFPEQVVYNLLLQNEINFIHRVTKKELPWAQSFEYDFYLPDKKIIIEAHGAQHYEEHGFGNVGGKTLIEEQENDYQKQCLAENNNTKYYAIDCRQSKIDFILNNILNSSLMEEIKLEVKNREALYNNVLIYKRNRLKILLNEGKYTNKDLLQILHISPVTLNELLRQIQEG